MIRVYILRRSVENIIIVLPRPLPPIALTHRITCMYTYTTHVPIYNMRVCCFFHLCIIYTHPDPPTFTVAAEMPPPPSHPHRQLFEPGGNRPNRF